MKLFTLRVATFIGEPLIVVDAFDANLTTSRFGHRRIDIQVRQGGKVVFPRGATYCALPAGASLSGIDAKELVLACVAMRPDDTDADYFASYTQEQRAWAVKYGQTLSCEREARYCDPETGGVRS